MKKLHRRALSSLLFVAGALHAMQVPSLALDAATAAPATTEADTAVWVQVATEGTYKGHSRGEFTLDAKVFGQLCQNLRNHPSYKRGPDGFGCSDVIPYDWRHASEQPVAAGGADPLATQAAYGWVRDLEMRRGADGKLQLWALSRFLPDAKEAIRAGRVKWTSIAIWPNATDPVKGSDIGWYMSSVALTNDPFVQGMAAIQADRAGNAAPLMLRYIDPYPPRSVGEMLERLRDLFGLPELSDLKTVVAQIKTLKSIVDKKATAPAGVEIDELVGCLRSIFNLPVLASPDEVFAQADKLEAALAAEEAIEGEGHGAGGNAGAPPKITAARTILPTAPHKENDMDPKTLIALIAGALGLPGTASSPEDVQKKFDEHIALHRAQGDKLKLLEKAGADVAAEAATASPGGDAGGMLGKLKSLLSYVGVKDTDAAMKGLSENYSRLKQMEKDLPELAEMYARQLSREETSVAEDVRATLLDRYGIDITSPDWKANPEVQMASGMLICERTGWTPIEPTLTNHAVLAERLKTEPAVRDRIKGVLASRDSARAAYLAKYPLTRPQQGQHAQPSPQNPGAALFGRYFGGTDGGAPVGGSYAPQTQPMVFGAQGHGGAPQFGAQPGNPMFGAQGGGQGFNGAPQGFGAGGPAMFGAQPGNGFAPVGIGGAGGAPTGEPQIDLAALMARPGNLTEKAVALFRDAHGPAGASIEFDAAFAGGRRLLEAAHRQAAAQGVVLK